MPRSAMSFVVIVTLAFGLYLRQLGSYDDAPGPSGSVLG
jgi:hypothetical protein